MAQRGIREHHTRGHSPDPSGRPGAVAELPEDVQRARDAVSGTYCTDGGPELTETLADALRAVSAPGMTPDAGSRRLTYRREPYGRARIPTSRGEILVDGKVLFVENGPLLNFSRHYAGGRRLDLFIPAAWVVQIRRHDSAWRDVYDDGH